MASAVCSISRARCAISSPAGVRATRRGCRSISCTPRLCFQLAQLRRQRRLADEAFGGGAAEMAGIGHRHQVAQVLEL